tara:strand:- start:1673 stop:1900 length:228 start_codon:yes stop_codon:yes gene_type:complete
MKLLLTTMLLTVSSGLLAHTGDHDGVWHDHGFMALIMMIASIGFYFLSRLNRTAILLKAKVKLNKLISTDISGRL